MMGVSTVVLFMLQVSTAVMLIVVTLIPIVVTVIALEVFWEGMGRGRAYLEVLYGFGDERVEMPCVTCFFRLVCEQSKEHTHEQERAHT